jgi:DNA-binding CsgD family transcriptional regulator
MRTSSQIGGWALNPLTGELVLSREAYPLFGFDSAGDSPTCPMVVARMHPDDRNDVGERAERAFRDGTSLEGEYRIVLPDGGVNHVRYVGHQVIQSPGGTRAYVGTLIDVTSQTDVEAQLDAKPNEARELAEKLTPREREIVELVAEARSTKQIAFQLGIGAKTVEAHRTHLMKKLGLHSASEVVRYAISNGIVDL